MTRTGFALSLGLILSAAVGAQDKLRLPPDVARFVENDTVAIDLKEGDVNGDGVKDYLLVLAHRTEMRDLLILIRQADGSLKLAGRNKTVIECGVCEGQGGNFRVVPKGNGFEVEDTAGAGGVGGRVRLKFEYITQEATWVLIEADHERYDGQTVPEEHEKHVRRPYNEGRVIRFDAFNGDEFGVLWGPP